MLRRTILGFAAGAISYALFLSCAYRAMDEGGGMNKFVIRFG